MSKKVINTRINTAIITKKIRLIDVDGKMIGVVNIKEGLDLAKRQKLDLVEISPSEDPPVCKILDFGKYRYKIKKKILGAKNKQKVVELKEIKLRPNIATGDLSVKLNNTKRLISEGNKVKVSLLFRGREIRHEKVGIEIIENFKVEALSFAKVETDLKKEGRQIFIIIGPK